MNGCSSVVVLELETTIYMEQQQGEVNSYILQQFGVWWGDLSGGLI